MRSNEVKRGYLSVFLAKNHSSNFELVFGPLLHEGVRCLQGLVFPHPHQLPQLHHLSIPPK